MSTSRKWYRKQPIRIKHHQITTSLKEAREPVTLKSLQLVKCPETPCSSPRLTILWGSSLGPQMSLIIHTLAANNYNILIINPQLRLLQLTVVASSNSKIWCRWAVSSISKLPSSLSSNKMRSSCSSTKEEVVWSSPHTRQQRAITIVVVWDSSKHSRSSREVWLRTLATDHQKIWQLAKIIARLVVMAISCYRSRKWCSSSSTTPFPCSNNRLVYPNLRCQASLSEMANNLRLTTRLSKSSICCKLLLHQVVAI